MSLNRMGHAYGLDANGEAEHAAFNLALAGVGRSYHGRASNLYGLLDNNDAFDYLGGLSLGVETLTGRRPEGLILQHADPAHPAVEPLATALLSELRGRYLNPEWIKPLMDHGYAGARTMGQEFLENLWGWQVTRPDLIQPWAWDEVKQTYFDDKQKLGLPQFLGQGHNMYVKAQMLAIFMVAAERQILASRIDATIKQMGSELVSLVRQERPARQRAYRAESSDVAVAGKQAGCGGCASLGCGAGEGTRRRHVSARAGSGSATSPCHRRGTGHLGPCSRLCQGSRVTALRTEHDRSGTASRPPRSLVVTWRTRAVRAGGGVDGDTQSSPCNLNELMDTSPRCRLGVVLSGAPEKRQVSVPESGTDETGSR